MTEPTLEKRDTWEKFLERKIVERTGVEILSILEEREEVRMDLKDDLYELFYQIECAEKHIAAQEVEF